MKRGHYCQKKGMRGHSRLLNEPSGAVIQRLSRSRRTPKTRALPVPAIPMVCSGAPVLARAVHNAACIPRGVTNTCPGPATARPGITSAHSALFASNPLPRISSSATNPPRYSSATCESMGSRGSSILRPSSTRISSSLLMILASASEGMTTDVALLL